MYIIMNICDYLNCFFFRLTYNLIFFSCIITDNIQLSTLRSIQLLPTCFWIERETGNNWQFFSFVFPIPSELGFPSSLYTHYLNWNRGKEDSCSNWTETGMACFVYTKKTRILFPFKLIGIWLWWQFSFRFWTKWKSIRFKLERKTVITIISHSIWKEM